MSTAEPSRQALVRENAELRRQVAEYQQQYADLENRYRSLEQDKNDLELLSETNIEHSDLMAEELLTQLSSARTLLLTKIARLRREIDRLQQQILKLQKERLDLEMLLETNMKLLKFNGLYQRNSCDNRAR